MRNVSEIPDGWVILKITNKEQIHHKVFATWVGGYLNGDAWKINSGITKLEEEGDYYYFYGHSGSCYKCRKDYYGVRTYYTKGVLGSIIEKTKDSGSEIEVMDENTNWTELFKNENI